MATTIEYEVDPHTSFYKIDKVDSDTLIVSFAGYKNNIGAIQQFEFRTFLDEKFHHVSRYFALDKYYTSYHKGLYNITKNVNDTAEYLKNEIKHYNNVIFIGVSSGGYAAILFGSLLNITSVLAYIPQTILRKKEVDEKYRDISKYINDTTKYYLYGDLSFTDELSNHNISHCERISHHPNVTIIRKDYVNVKSMRYSGELYAILNKLVNKHYESIV